MPRPSKQLERRAQILDGLFDAMAHAGSGASITDIATAAGIARGALHYYFESKDEIRVALMRRLGERYAAGLEGALKGAAERDRSPMSGLVRFHFGGDEDESARLLGVWIDFWGQAPADPEMGAVVFEVQETARGFMRRALLQTRPELRALDDDTLRAHAATLLALIEGGLLQWRVAATSPRPLHRAPLAAQLLIAAERFVQAVPAPAGVTNQREPIWTT